MPAFIHPFSSIYARIHPSIFIHLCPHSSVHFHPSMPAFIHPLSSIYARIHPSISIHPFSFVISTFFIYIQFSYPIQFHPSNHPSISIFFLSLTLVHVTPSHHHSSSHLSSSLLTHSTPIPPSTTQLPFNLSIHHPSFIHSSSIIHQSIHHPSSINPFIIHHSSIHHPSSIHSSSIIHPFIIHHSSIHHPSSIIHPFIIHHPSIHQPIRLSTNPFIIHPSSFITHSLINHPSIRYPSIIHPFTNDPTKPNKTMLQNQPWPTLFLPFQNRKLFFSFVEGLTLHKSNSEFQGTETIFFTNFLFFKLLSFSHSRNYIEFFFIWKY